MVETAVAGIGWGAAGLLLTAYLLASVERLAAGGRAFQVLNLVGAIGLTLNSGYHRAWPSALLNSAWIAIGLVVLARRASHASAATSAHTAPMM
jgi:hypothetical protein